MANTVFYYLLRGPAIALGGACTGWAAYQSWQHSPWDLTGPLAAVAAAAMFIFCEYAVKGRQWVHFSVLGVLGLLAAAISGSVVLQRNGDNQARREASAQSGNLPGWRPTRPCSQQRRSSKRLRPRQQLSARRVTPCERCVPRRAG